MLIASLPSCITRCFCISQDENWRSDQNPDIFLSRAARASSQEAHENRDHEFYTQLAMVNVGFL